MENMGQNGEGRGDQTVRKRRLFDSAKIPQILIGLPMPWRYIALNIIFRFLLSWSLFVGRSAKLE